MAKFTKYNNPNRRRRTRKSPYSHQYIEERRDEMYRLISQAETDSEKDAIIKAFNAAIHP